MNSISVAVLIFSAAGLAVPWAFFALRAAIRGRITAAPVPQNQAGRSGLGLEEP